MDLADVGTPGFSWRRLGVLVRTLPRESATRAEVVGAAEDWTVTDHLLAALFDAVQQLTWASTNGKDRDRPTPMRRPGDPLPENRTRLSARDVVARLKAQLRR